MNGLGMNVITMKYTSTTGKARLLFVVFINFLNLGEKTVCMDDAALPKSLTVLKEKLGALSTALTVITPMVTTKPDAPKVSKFATVQVSMTIEALKSRRSKALPGKEEAINVFMTQLGVTIYDIEHEKFTGASEESLKKLQEAIKEHTGYLKLIGKNPDELTTTFAPKPFTPKVTGPAMRPIQELWDLAPVKAREAFGVIAGCNEIVSKFTTSLTDADASSTAEGSIMGAWTLIGANLDALDDLFGPLIGITDAEDKRLKTSVKNKLGYYKKNLERIKQQAQPNLEKAFGDSLGGVIDKMQTKIKEFEEASIE